MFGSAIRGSPRSGRAIDRADSALRARDPGPNYGNASREIRKRAEPVKRTHAGDSTATLLSVAVIPSGARNLEARLSHQIPHSARDDKLPLQNKTADERHESRTKSEEDLETPLILPAFICVHRRFQNFR
jgi:hypothetical protein